MTEGEDEYEIIPVTPIKKLEQRVQKMEKGGTVPQLQGLINQIIELIRSNQKIVNDIIRDNTKLRNEFSKLPPKIDELMDNLKKFFSLIEIAGREETTGPSSESLKPIVEQLKMIADQNQKLIENNQEVINRLNKLGRRTRGTPVSKLLSSYPRRSLRKPRLIRRELKRGEK